MMVNHSQQATMINHTQHYSTMLTLSEWSMTVNHGLPLSTVYHNQPWLTIVKHGQSRSTIVNYGQTTTNFDKFLSNHGLSLLKKIHNNNLI